MTAMDCFSQLRNLSILLLLASCSLWTQNSEGLFQKMQKRPKEAFHKHLNYWGNTYLESPEVKLYRLSLRSKKYLKDLYDLLIKNNEIFLQSKIKPSFYVVKNDLPFFFSLPNGKYVFSSGIITKYVRNEEILVSLLAYEMVKSINRIYRKTLLLPTKKANIEKIIKILSLKLQDRIEIRKMAYYLLVRSGFDGFTFLRWLQIKNRNTLDFSLYHVTEQSIVQEEFMFKNFLTKQEMPETSVFNKNSSEKFYEFMKEIRSF